VKFMDPRQAAVPAVILRWYEDAWSEDIVPPADASPAPGSGYLPLLLPGGADGTATTTGEQP